MKLANGFWRTVSLYPVTPFNSMPNPFMQIEESQLYNKANPCKDKATTKVAKPQVGHPKANQVAKDFKGKTFYECPSWSAVVRFHFFPFLASFFVCCLTGLTVFSFTTFADRPQFSPIQSKKYQRFSRSISGSCDICSRYRFTSSQVEKIISNGSVPKSQSGVCSTPWAIRTIIGFLQRFAQ